MKQKSASLVLPPKPLLDEPQRCKEQPGRTQDRHASSKTCMYIMTAFVKIVTMKIHLQLYMYGFVVYLEKLVKKSFPEKISTLTSFVVSQQFAHILGIPLVSLW